MKKYLFMMSCLLLFSCKSTPSPEPVSTAHSAIRTGLYKSKSPRRLEWLNLRLQGIKGCYSGSELFLNPDSTYDMRTCGSISKGRWHTEGSRLLLKEEYLNWRLDTFRKHGFEGRWPEVRKEPLVYIIKGDLIYQVWKNHIDMMGYSSDKPFVEQQ